MSLKSSSMPQNEFHVTLSRLGLTTNEVRCYLTALETGSLSVPQLAKKTGLDRSNIYRAVDGLARHGLVSRSGESYGSKVHAASPRKLQTIAADLQRRAKRNELKITELLPEFMGLYRAGGIRPRVQYFEDPVGVMHVFDDCLEEPGVTEILNCTSADFSMLPGFVEWDRSFIRRRVKLGISIKIIACFNESSTSWGKHDHEEFRETRFIPEKFAFPGSTLIYGNKVAIISHDKENMGIIIESKELSQMHRALFKYMWEGKLLNTI